MQQPFDIDAGSSEKEKRARKRGMALYDQVKADLLGKPIPPLPDLKSGDDEYVEPIRSPIGDTLPLLLNNYNKKRTKKRKPLLVSE